MQLTVNHPSLCRTYGFFELAARVWQETAGETHEEKVQGSVAVLDRLGHWLGGQGITNLLNRLSPAEQLLETFKAAQNRIPKRVFLARWYPPEDAANGAHNKATLRLQQLHQTLTNILATHGEWHEGRMLASGPRINPWLQEATQRVIESGDLVGFDTDMVGPLGYFCDISRTFHCGPAAPTERQKEIYRLAYEEVRHNMKLIRPGITFHELQQQSFPIPEAFQENAYTCIVHGVGMCDEYPRIDPFHRGLNPYNGTLEAGMVVTVESYMGAVGERDGVKLEEQVLITEDGCELLSSYPMEESLLN